MIGFLSLKLFGVIIFQGEHHEATFVLKLLRSLDIYPFPSLVLVPEVNPLNRGDNLAEPLPKRVVNLVVLITRNVHKSLKDVKVSSIRCNHGPWISSCVIHRWHGCPFVVENIEFFAICDHFFWWITATDHVDKTVFKIVVSGKRRSTYFYGLKFLDLIGQEVKLKYVCDWLGLIFLHVIPWNDNDPIVRGVDCSSILQLLVQLIMLLISSVWWLQLAPPRNISLGVFSFFYDLWELFVHQIPWSILVNTILAFYMVWTFSYVDWLDAKWNNLIVKFLRELLHPHLMIAW